MNSVITPDKAQHNTACAVYVSETYTHKHVTENIQNAGSSTKQPPFHEETKEGVLYCGAGSQSQSLPSDCAWEKSMLSVSRINGPVWQTAV